MAEAGFRRGLQQSFDYPYTPRLHKNLLLILSISNSLFTAADFIKEGKTWPENGPIPLYPNPQILKDAYAFYLRELLIETALFMRGQDDFWMQREGVTGWPNKIKQHCGHSEFVKEPKEAIDLTLREACNKLIHHTIYDYGWDNDKTNTIVLLRGKKEKQDWIATINLRSFCDLAMFSSGFSYAMIPRESKKPTETQ